MSTEEQPNEQPGGVRASNSDRERVASILRAAGTEGMLTLAEMDERLAVAYSATYRHELEPLTADLPGGGRPLYAGSPEGQAQRVQFASHVRHRLIRHGVVATAAVGIALTLWAIFTPSHFFPGPVIAIAVISLAVHARRARYGYGRPPWYGPGWHGHAYQHRSDQWA
jgi:hypothetical protein